MADTLSSGVYERTNKVSPGSAVFEEILKGLRKEKETSDKKFDAAIAAVTALVPRDVEVRVNFQVAAADVPAFEAEQAKLRAANQASRSFAAELRAAKNQPPHDLTELQKLAGAEQKPRSDKPIKLSASQKAVFMAVSRRAATPSTIKAIARATKLKRDHVIVILSEITRRGLIKRVGRGLYARK